MGCQALHLRSISPNFPDGFVPCWFSPHLHLSTVLQGRLVSWYSLSHIFLEEPLFLRGRGVIARLLRAHLLSVAFGANNNTYTHSL